MKKIETTNLKENKRLNAEQMKLVENNIALAYSRANIMHKRYCNNNNYKLFVDKDDIQSYAFEGLCEAACRFDVDRKTKFSTFAVSYIDNYIKTNVYNENPTIKVPSGSPDKDKAKYLRHLALSNALFTNAEIECNDSAEQGVVLNILCSYGIPEKGFEQIEDSMYVDSFSKALTDKEIAIFKSLVLDDFNLSDTAEILDIHLNTVSRRKKRIAQKLRRHFVST